MPPILRALAAVLLLGGAIVAPAAADELLYVPFANGRFEAGAAGWALASGVLVGDGDYDGDLEAIVPPGVPGTQLGTVAPQSPVRATTRLMFSVDRGAIEGAVVRDRLIDPSGGAGATIAWALGTVEPARHVLDPATATTASIAGWTDMTPDERRSALSGLVHGAVELDGEATFRFGTLVDTFQWVLEA